jgi:hypothetical protein
MNIFKRLFPREEREADAREQVTKEAIEENKKARRIAEANLIKSYRRMDLEVRRHGWSE